MYQEYNPNPTGKRREDCVIRALTKALNVDWDTAYMKLSAKGFEEKEMPSVNWVWGALLRDMKFTRVGLPNTCPACYTLKDFCRDNRDSDGRYSRDMYSRDGGMMMRERLEQLRNEAKDEHQRRIIDDMLNRL